MEKSTENPAPGFKQYPGHRVSARPARVRVRVTVRGEVIADSKNAIALEEAMGGKTVAPVVYYLPRADVKMDRLVRASHETHCPFKGQASHYAFRDGPENAVWGYETPYDEMRSIRGMLALYPDKEDSI